MNLELIESGLINANTKRMTGSVNISNLICATYELNPQNMALIKRQYRKESGTYQFIDIRDKTLYVGESGNLGRRFSEHFNNTKGITAGYLQYFYKIVIYTFEHFDVEEDVPIKMVSERLALENILINDFTPLINCLKIGGAEYLEMLREYIQDYLT